MAWTLYHWIWKLESPLYIGWHPSGALNRCRLYVPARTMWGATTAEIARKTFANNMEIYKMTGEDVNKNCRFTYLYPAEKKGEHYLTWLPKYEKDKGLIYVKYNTGEEITEREFKKRLLITRAGTAVSPDTDSALDASLHETECMNQWWRCSENTYAPKPVYLVGYVFINNSSTEITKEKLQNNTTLFIGGDTRYGLGKISLVGSTLEKQGDVWGSKIKEDTDDPVVTSSTLYWHHSTDDFDNTSEEIIGEQELVRGWDHNSKSSEPIQTWKPGSNLATAKPWKIKKCC